MVFGANQKLEDLLPKSQHYPEKEVFPGPVNQEALMTPREAAKKKMSESARKPDILDDQKGGRQLYSTPNPNFGDIVTELLTKVPGVASD